MRSRAQMLGIIPLVLGIVLLPGCSRQRDPQAAFDHAREASRRGDMVAATNEAERGYGTFHSLSAEWAWKFTILRASALHGRGMDEEALKILSSEPTPIPPGELAIKKRRLEGQAYTSLHKFDEAEHEFDEAEHLCAVADLPACADVVAARGAMEMHRGRYSQAQSLFARVLPKAHASGNSFWEASALLDLSWSADEQTHFDEALDWANAARQISVAHGYADISQTALGNRGWANYNRGDSEKAQVALIEARKEAEKLGDGGDQAQWLQALGYIYLRSETWAGLITNSATPKRLRWRLSRPEKRPRSLAMAVTKRSGSKPSATSISDLKHGLGLLQTRRLRKGSGGAYRGPKRGREAWRWR